MLKHAGAESSSLLECDDDKGEEDVLMPGYDNICYAPRRRHKLVLSRLHIACVLCYDPLQVPASLFNISQNTPRQAQIVICIHINLHRLRGQISTRLAV